MQPEIEQETSDNQLTARIHSIETGGAVDGPGIRYIVFFQGCNFKCQYCHNRDTWDLTKGEITTVDKLMKEIKTYGPFFKASAGGVTASGGEASIQAKFVTELFKAVHQAGYNTCLDTNGYFVTYNQDKINLINETDLFLLDLKCMNDERHKELTGRTNIHTLNFAKYLKEHNKKMWIRLVVVPTFTDDDKNAIEMGEFIKELGDSVERVELLAYHELGKHKWDFFNDPYKLSHIKPPTAEVMQHLRDILKQYHSEIH